MARFIAGTRSKNGGKILPTARLPDDMGRRQCGAGVERARSTIIVEMDTELVRLTSNDARLETVTRPRYDRRKEGQDPWRGVDRDVGTVRMDRRDGHYESVGQSSVAYLMTTPARKHRGVLYVFRPRRLENRLPPNRTLLSRALSVVPSIQDSLSDNRGCFVLIEFQSDVEGRTCRFETDSDEGLCDQADDVEREAWS